MTPLEFALQAILFAPLPDQRATVLDSVQYYRSVNDQKTVAIISWLIEAYPKRGLGYMNLNYMAANLPYIFPNVQ